MPLVKTTVAEIAPVALSGEVCGSSLTGRQRRFCSRNCKGRHHACYTAQRARGLQRKLEIVRLLGGKCVACGYGKNLAGLTFHHEDPSLKGFALDMRSISNRTLVKVMAELNKRSLLCHNCHAELHHPHLTMDLLD